MKHLCLSAKRSALASAIASIGVTPAWGWVPVVDDVRHTVTHVAREADNGLNAVGTGVVVLSKVPERTAQGIGGALDHAAKQLGDGKVPDMGADLLTSPVRIANKVVVKSAQDSPLLMRWAGLA